MNKFAGEKFKYFKRTYYKNFFLLDILSIYFFIFNIVIHLYKFLQYILADFSPPSFSFIPPPSFLE
jgi:hypothetical protein